MSENKENEQKKCETCGQEIKKETKQSLAYGEELA